MSTTADRYREKLKEGNLIVNKHLKTKNEEYKKLIQRTMVNTCEDVQDLDTNFGRISDIMEDQNKIIGDTHELTEKVIDSLKSKEIYCLRDWIKKFFTQVKGRYNARAWLGEINGCFR